MLHFPAFASPIILSDTAPTTALFTGLLDDTVRHSDSPMSQAVPVACLKRLIAARAWTDAALALLALRLPDWRVRQLVRDDGEWHCSLTRHVAMPDWLDTTADAHHAHMALSIVGAMQAAAVQPAQQSAPCVNAPEQTGFTPLLCDDFA